MSESARLHGMLSEAMAALEGGREQEALQGLVGLPATAEQPECVRARVIAKQTLRGAAVRDEVLRKDLINAVGTALWSLGDDSAAETCARSLWGEPSGTTRYVVRARAQDVVGHCRAEGALLQEFPQFAPFGAFLLRLRDASVLGGSFLPMTASGSVLVDRCMESTPKLDRFSGLQQLDMMRMATSRRLLVVDAPRHRYAGRHVLLGSHDNIGHWLLFYLSRLHLLEGRAELADARFVVAENASALHVECLARAGVEQARLLRLPRGRLAEFEELWVPSFLAWGSATGSFILLPQVVQFVRRALRVPASRATGPRRIFLGRRGARWRRLLNEPEIMDLLAPLGFVGLDPGRLSLQEQIDVAAGAEVIVACFGAAAMLHLFAPPGATVVQLQSTEQPPMNLARGLTHLLGQRYLQVVGESADSHSDPLKSDFRVSPQQVLEAVSDALRV